MPALHGPDLRSAIPDHLARVTVVTEECKKRASKRETEGEGGREGAEEEARQGDEARKTQDADDQARLPVILFASPLFHLWVTVTPATVTQMKEEQQHLQILCASIPFPLLSP